MNIISRQITVVLSAALLLVACKKDKKLEYPWSINFNDGTNNYQFVGNSTKEVRDGDRAVFEAFAGYGRLPNGQLTALGVSCGFDTYNGNPERIGLGIRMMNWDTAFLRLIDPVNTGNSAAARLTALQQWLTNKTFRLSPNTAELKVYYKDALGQEWVEDINSSGEATVTGAAPFSLQGYSQSLRANIQFNINMVRYSNTAPYTVLARQSISGTMTGFFTLEE